MRQISLFILSLFVLISCNTECGHEINTTEIDLQVVFNRADLSQLEINDNEDVAQWFNQNPAITHFFLEDFDGLKPEIRAENANNFKRELSKIFVHQEFKKLIAETHKQIGDFSVLENDFQEAFRRYKYFDPTFKAPAINTMVTGFLGYDCVLNKDQSGLMIGLEYFLNDKSTYSDQGMPMYMQEHSKLDNLLPKSILLLQNRINAFDPADQTLIAHMVYYGKAYYFASQILPCSPERTILEYTEAEMTEIATMEKYIYSKFVSDKLFFEKSHEVRARYLNPRPEVSEIGPNCPGRIGRWLGYQIVKKYVEETEISLMDLMKESDAKKIFSKARYKPQDK